MNPTLPRTCKEADHGKSDAHCFSGRRIRVDQYSPGLLDNSSPALLKWVSYSGVTRRSIIRLPSAKLHLRGMHILSSPTLYMSCLSTGLEIILHDTLL